MSQPLKDDLVAFTYGGSMLVSSWSRAICSCLANSQSAQAMHFAHGWADFPAASMPVIAHGSAPPGDLQSRNWLPSELVNGAPGMALHRMSASISSQYDAGWVNVQ